MPVIPDFRSAVLDFRHFLSTHGIEAQPLWVFREHVLMTGKSPFLCWPLPPENTQLAEQHFEGGRLLGMGIQLSLICLAGDHPCCYLFVPGDDDEASWTMTQALKLSVPTDLRQARRINRWCWPLAARVGRAIWQQSDLERLPRRAAI